MNQRLVVDQAKLADFCRKWRIRELALFGSALREDFGPDSDVDILVRFFAEADWGLLDHVRMEEELQDVLGRKVDLVSCRAIEQSPNWIRRKNILESAQPLYAA